MLDERIEGDVRYRFAPATRELTATIKKKSKGSRN